MIAALKLPGQVYQLWRQLRLQEKFLQTHIAITVDKAFKTNDGSLDLRDREKIFRYYGLAVPAVLGQAICMLHGRTLSFPERLASTAQGAMTGLFDDFFDKHDLTISEIDELLEQQHPTKQSSNKKLFLNFYELALSNTVATSGMKQSLKEVSFAQLQSHEQLLASTSQERIHAITFLKGGKSLLFYRTANHAPSSEPERELLYQLGGLMQLCNDIFDVYKDREAGVRTLITEATNIRPLQAELKQSLQQQAHYALSNKFDKKRLFDFFAILSLAIFSRALTCLDRLHQAETTTDGLFQVQRYSRRQLICDMQLPVNLAQSARYHVQLMNSFQKL